MQKPTEYEFERPDGAKFYEIVDPDCGVTIARQIRMFSETHGATMARPVRQGQKA